MARRATLPSLGLSPFGGSSGGFGAFNVGQARTERAYLTFRKVEIEWQNGRVSNDAYLAAMQTYAGALRAGSSERLNVEARIEDTRYRVERDVLMAAVEEGTKTLDDLIAYEAGKLEGLVQDSLEYNQRLNNLQSAQNRKFNEDEQDITDRYRKGLMTAAQLQTWYQEQAVLVGGRNPQLTEAIASRLDNLSLTVQNEQDALAIQSYNEGRSSTAEFLAYAAGAQARYVPGTSQYRDWAERIDKATKQAQETNLLYRYGLSQDYARLQEFVQSNSGPLTGRTSTSQGSETRRLVLQADGTWKTVTTRTGGGAKTIAPTAAQVEAYKKLQVQIASARQQMTDIERQLGAVPGSWVGTQQVIDYYRNVQADLAPQSQDWYQVQSKIDNLNAQLHTEQVKAQLGFRVTYPGGGSPAPVTKSYLPTTTLASGAVSSGGGGVSGGAVSGRTVAPSTTGTPQQGTVAPFQAVTGVSEPARRSGDINLLTTRVGFATAVPASGKFDFDDFFRAYETAFKNGDQTFRFGDAVYFVGDDPAERIAGMRALDTAKINLYTEVILGGSARTESQQAAARDNLNKAIVAAAGHELRILATENEAGLQGGPVAQVNPIATGKALLDRQVEGIKSNIDLANIAFARGDLTSGNAYLQKAWQIAGLQTDGSGRMITNATNRNIAGYAALGAFAIEQISARYGVDPTQALGEGDFEKLTGSLADLQNWEATLLDTLNTYKPSLTADTAASRVLASIGAKPSSGKDLLTTLKTSARTDAAGNLALDSAGNVVLADGFYYELDEDGAISIKRASGGAVNLQTGKFEPFEKGTVTMVARVGNNVVPVVAKYSVGTVGYFHNPGLDRMAITGKIVQQVIDGKTTVWFEDPITGGWSSTPIVYTPPQAFSAKPVTGGTVYEFVYDGATYRMNSDRETGVYTLSRLEAEGFGGKITETPLSLEDSRAIFADIGFARDLSSLTADQKAFAQLPYALPGFTPLTYEEYRRATFESLTNTAVRKYGIELPAPLIKPTTEALSGTALQAFDAAAGIGTEGAPPVWQQQQQHVQRESGLPSLTPLPTLNPDRLKDDLYVAPKPVTQTQLGGALTTGSKDDTYVAPKTTTTTTAGQRPVPLPKLPAPPPTEPLPYIAPNEPGQRAV